MAEKLRLRAPNVWAQARPTIATLDNANPGVTASNACADLARPWPEHSIKMSALLG